MFHSHTIHVKFNYGNLSAYEGVSDAWGFLCFAPGGPFSLAQISLINCVCISSTHAAVKMVAVLSRLAGFIAVAMQIAPDTCSQGKGDVNCCGDGHASL
ncbi:hypothetical protein ASPZODRAFT_20797 [Penicilliopsis zonata CBS 506.65]|uniref:Uncharacterized protein n=1 Tax=Penicilliopsis zonata CBS 506.65 TaxID=1073090 RepID=A0A1L9S4L7_9EURO|nr:hypothetical protein ASPZODRAFT_20797 [Penicilliopsis zonata CBS 506.65]OJJ42110.1 hypothetical protein ASPZODRAFT_20797 [Penicilliopsis zonata CBS 506.65]